MSVRKGSLSYLVVTLLAIASITGSLTAMSVLSQTPANASQQPQYVSIPGSVLPIVSSAKTVGNAPSNTLVSFAIILPLQNRDQLAQLITQIYNPQSPLYHHYLTPDQFHSMFSPSESQYQAVVNYLESQGLQVTYTSANRLIVGAQGTVSQVSQALKTTIQLYSYKGQVFYANSQPVELPSNLQVAAVFGLTNYTLFTPQVINLNKTIKPMQISTSCATTFGCGFQDGPYIPQQIQQAYSLTQLYSSGYNGTGITIGIVDAYTAPGVQQDLNQFDADFSLPNTQINVIYPTGVPVASGLVTGWIFETLLDTQWAHAAAPGAKINLYLAFDAGDSLFEAVNYAVDSGAVNVITQSWGAPEPFLTKQVVFALDQIYQQAAAEGISVFASSGDSSADNHLGFLNVIYPASDPYVTSVGGTTLYAQAVSSITSSPPFSTGGGRINETAWSTNVFFGWGTGGGSSEIFSCPTYQASVCGIQGTSGRIVPDVAADADPFTGVLVNAYSIFGFDIYYIIGGTSLSSPLWAATTAVLDSDLQAHGKLPAGFLNPFLYSEGMNLYQNPGFGENGAFKALNDIVDGNNGASPLTNGIANVLGFSATKGYDPVSGWGTPVATGLASALLSVRVNALEVIPPSVNTNALPAQVVVEGSTNEPAGSTVTITSTPRLFSPITTTVNSTGGFSARFTVQQGTASGVYEISAYFGSTLLASVNFVVGPVLQLSPQVVHEGVSVTLQGLGFAPNTQLNVTADFTPPLSFTLTTNSTGGFSLSFTVPPSPAITVDVVAKDAMGNSARALLKLLPAIALSSYSGSPGTNISITGVTFSSFVPVAVFFGNQQVANFTTNGNGDFTGVFTVPNVPAGTYTVTAVDLLNYSASTSFTVSIPAVVAATLASQLFYMLITSQAPASQAFFTNSSTAQVGIIKLYLAGNGMVQVSLGTSVFSSNLFSANIQVNGTGWYTVVLPSPITLNANSVYFLSVSNVSGSVYWAYSTQQYYTYVLNTGPRYYYNAVGLQQTTLSSWIYEIYE